MRLSPYVLYVLLLCLGLYISSLHCIAVKLCLFFRTIPQRRTLSFPSLSSVIAFSLVVSLALAFSLSHSLCASLLASTLSFTFPPSLEQAVSVAACADGSEGVVVTLRSGRTLTAESAIVATGAFTDASLLAGVTLPLTMHGRTVLLVDVTDALATHPSLADLPAMIAVPCPGGEGTPCDDVYILPPIRYADGRLYMKIGTSVYDNHLATRDAVNNWFRGPPSAPDLKALWADIAALYPVLTGLPHRTANCALTRTPSTVPILQEVAPRVFAAVGGNGAAAKSSDEIGRLAATLALGCWDVAYDLAAFDGTPLSPADATELGVYKP